MATLQEIGFTLATGAVVCAVSTALFGIAVYKRSIFVAPRATARPRNVIYNPDPVDSSQERGNPFTGWVWYTLGLTYDSMLKGVPGTGTRNGGLSGSMLKVNMEAIVLLRFHALGLKVTCLATFLCLAIILPIYMTSPCHNLSEEDVDKFPGCQTYEHNITNYEQTTLVNVPALTDRSTWKTFVHPYYGVLGRLYAVTFIFWILVVYVLHVLREEWIHMLAIRRVYHFEQDVWGKRLEELKQTFHSAEDAAIKKRTKQHLASDEDYLTNREPWIPHPEQRETVPSIALYTVLVGGLPSLPEQAADAFDTEATINFSKRESIDWQLLLTRAFFDHCVPNQPGFSSSVAAVTIIPGAQDISFAWKKWYTTAAKLRRLRFIRMQIAKRRNLEIEAGDSDDESSEPIDIEKGISEKERSQPECLTPRGVYNDPTEYKRYFRQVLGSMLDDQGDSIIQESLEFGPEQMAMYTREFAQAAAACCPNGCNERRVRRASINELLDLEQEVIAELHQANLELKEARRRATRADPQGPELEQESSSKPGESTTTAPQAPSPNAQKTHRKTPSLEGANLPANLGLEAGLYSAMVDKEAAHRSLKDEHMTAIREDALHQEGASTSVEPKTATGSSGVRLPTGFDSEEGTRHEPGSSEWADVELMVKDARKNAGLSNSDPSERSDDPRVATGVWVCPSLRSIHHRTFKKVNVMKWAKTKSSAAVDEVARETTYAVVTFTSRQAAVAARNCLADGRGQGRWVNLSHMPVPPLADAAPCDLCVCRNCCRPVTVSISDQQKSFRHGVALCLLAAIYILYTVPLAAASSLIDPERLNQVFPGFASAFGTGFGNVVAGLVTALLWSTFFALCPAMFKSIAYFGSKATSMAAADYSALKYYWWFMVLTAFTGNFLAQAFLNGVDNGLQFASEFQTVLRAIASTLPSTVAFTWLNWIIVRFTITLPMNYLLQFNTFLFFALGWKCCSRMVRGGGPGGPIPYRIYIDSSVVLMCAFALAPVSPLVAPACFLYFLLCQPLLRRNVIYVYRPRFDGGGFRWPFIFKMCYSALIVGEVCLFLQMLLKAAIGPTIVAGLTLVPTILAKNRINEQYLRAYEDAALLQTSQLDGWDNSAEISMDKREEFRRFLVDAHKAAYVPVCLSSGDTDDFLTAEPAVAIPLDSQLAKETSKIAEEPLPGPTLSAESDETALLIERRSKKQHGATFRRAANVVMAMQRKSSSGEGTISSSARDKESYRVTSPFQRSSGQRDLFHKSE